MIKKFYEITCDECSVGEHPCGNNIEEVEAEFRQEGGIITASGKHYCNKGCYKKSNLKEADNGEK